MYKYRVVASDAGQPRLSATSQLDVEILDVDDELPHFEVAEYQFQISENRPIGAVVGRVEATDRDWNPQFRRVVYFTGDEEEGSKFKVFLNNKPVGD